MIKSKVFHERSEISQEDVCLLGNTALNKFVVANNIEREDVISINTTYDSYWNNLDGIHINVFTVSIVLSYWEE